jgi:hypothetical protein
VALAGIRVARMVPLALGDQGSITAAVMAMTALGRWS